MTFHMVTIFTIRMTVKKSNIFKLIVSGKYDNNDWGCSTLVSWKNSLFRSDEEFSVNDRLSWLSLLDERWLCLLDKSDISDNTYNQKTHLNTLFRWITVKKNTNIFNFFIPIMIRKHFSQKGYLWLMGNYYLLLSRTSQLQKYPLD